MTIIYVSPAGSNTSPYDTWEKAATNPQSAISLLAADGDEVVLDDEAFTINTMSDAAISAPSGASFTIRSRSNNPATCSFDRANATLNCFQFNNASNDWNWTIKGLKLTNSVTMTGGGGAALRGTGNFTGSVTFDNCDLNGFTFTYSATHGALVVRVEGVGADATLTNTTLRNLTASNTGAVVFEPFVYVANGSMTLQDVTITDVSKTQSANNQTNFGMFRCRRDSIINNVSVDNYVSSCPDASTGTHHAFVYIDNIGYSTSVNGLYALDTDASGATITKTGGEHTGGLFHTTNIFSVQNVISEEISVTEDVTNGIGCTVSASGATAQGTIDNIITRNCTAQHGCAVYMSQGAGATINNIIAHDNTAVGRAGAEAGAAGGCYFGGWGDCTINFGLFYNNTADEGGAIYAHVHGSATRAPTRNLNNITTFNNTATGADGGVGGDGIVCKGSIAAHQHTVNIVNNISWNAGTDEIQGTGSYLTLNIDHSDIRGGAGAVTGEDTYTNNINSDPLFNDSSNADFTLGSFSPCLYQGVNIGLSGTLARFSNQ
jgi:hypothetical protein